MVYSIAPVWEVLYKWICFVHKWYIALLLGDIATGDIASVWELAKSSSFTSDWKICIYPAGIITRVAPASKFKILVYKNF